MKTLNELFEKLYASYFTETQDEFVNLEDIHKVFWSYIKQKYENMLTKISDSKMQEFMLNEWYKSESKKLSFMTIKQRLGMISLDDALIKLTDCSREIFCIAMEKKNAGSITQEKIERSEQLLAKIFELIDAVLDVNELIAKKELSEAIVEVNYIKETSDFYSIRMSNELRYEN